MDNQAGPSRPRRPSSNDRPSAKLRSSDEYDSQSIGAPPEYEENAPRSGLLNGKDDGMEEVDYQQRQSGESISSHRQVASVEQRKAIWWRNVIITGIFIASW